MKKIKLFHFFEQKYDHIIAEIEKSKRRLILQNAVTVYAGIGRFAALSADDEIHTILRNAGCHELSRPRAHLRRVLGKRLPNPPRTP